MQLNDSFDEQDLNEHPNSKKMVTETSKVHNDYEFTPTKDCYQN